MGSYILLSPLFVIRFTVLIVTLPNDSAEDSIVLSTGANELGHSFPQLRHCMTVGLPCPANMVTLAALPFLNINSIATNREANWSSSCSASNLVAVQLVLPPLA